MFNKIKDWIKRLFTKKEKHKHDWINVFEPGSIFCAKKTKTGKKKFPYILKRCWCGKEEAFIITGANVKTKIDAENLRAILRSEGIKIREYEHESLK